jgi:hypothetical protein
VAVAHDAHSLLAGGVHHRERERAEGKQEKDGELDWRGGGVAAVGQGGTLRGTEDWVAVGGDRTILNHFNKKIKK